jgi:hypothetical protein
MIACDLYVLYDLFYFSNIYVHIHFMEWDVTCVCVCIYTHYQVNIRGFCILINFSSMIILLGYDFKDKLFLFLETLM